MADVYEQNLASKSTLTTTDYIRVVGSDNVSYKQLVSDVAKKIIENYTGSTLAESAQSVKSAVDSLNSNKAGKVRVTTSGSFNSPLIHTYANTVLEDVRTNISSYSSGILDIGSGTGPRFGVVLYKFNNSYWSALVMTYASSNWNLYYAKYENGQCHVTAYN